MKRGFLVAKFLTAKWHNLIMLNYEVKPLLLQEYVPNGTTLDFYDGKCYVSLVAFQFLDTKVFSFSIPYHIDFEEVNLRFYVKRKTKEGMKRGVVFIKEIVPKPLIAFAAKMVYGEPYESWDVTHKESENELTYRWSDMNCKNCLHIEIGENLGVPEEDSHGGFIIEHYWGYTKRSLTRTDEYRVEHPKWELFDVNYTEIDVDFSNTYGKQFGFLSETEPYSVLFTKGSEISVYKGEKLRIK